MKISSLLVCCHPTHNETGISPRAHYERINSVAKIVATTTTAEHKKKISIKCASLLCNLYWGRDRCTVAFSITKLKCVPTTDHTLNQNSTNNVKVFLHFSFSMCYFSFVRYACWLTSDCLCADRCARHAIHMHNPWSIVGFAMCCNCVCTQEYGQTRNEHFVYFLLRLLCIALRISLFEHAIFPSLDFFLDDERSI